MPQSMVDALKELAAENRESGLSLVDAYIAAAGEMHDEFMARREEIGEMVELPEPPEGTKMPERVVLPLADLSDEEVDEMFAELFGG